MTALDPGFHAVDSVFQVHNSRYFVTATWIPDSKAQDSRFHEEKIPGFRNPDSLTRGDKNKCLLSCVHEAASFYIIYLLLDGTKNEKF